MYEVSLKYLWRLSSYRVDTIPTDGMMDGRKQVVNNMSPDPDGEAGGGGGGT